MSRYIDVSEDAIKSVFKKLNHKNIYPKVTDEMILRNYLDEFPTADVVERKHGEWVKDEEKSKRLIESIYICSACHNFEAWGETEKYNYCPNCGAKMDERRAR